MSHLKAPPQKRQSCAPRIPIPPPLHRHVELTFLRKYGYASLAELNRSSEQRRSALIAQVKAWTEIEASHAS
jgi:hypothetical protein